MRLPSSKTRGRFGIALLAVAVLAFAGNCTLGPLQALLFHFTLDQAIAEGADAEVHRAFYPAALTLRKHWVRVSGHLDTGDEAPPGRLTVTIEGEDQVSGKRNHRLTVKLVIADDGSFSATKRIKKNIPAGTIQSISASPSGAGLAAGVEVWLCVDIAKNKADLAPAAECHGGNTGGTPTDEIQIVEVLDDAFEPKSVTIQPGTTVRWVLRGDRSNHTTTEMNATWDSGFVFVEEGDFFEHTFDASTDGQTFMYSCVSHKDCCEMQGSVRVGENAPEPDTDY